MNCIANFEPGLGLKVLNRPVSSLKPYKGNARTHTRTQIRQIAESIRTWGFNNPLLIDEDLSILAGHGRVEAAKLLGFYEVPTIQLSHMTEADKRAYRLADNRLAELAGWDDDLLRLELGFLLETDLDFDIETTGFDTADIDGLLQFGAEAEEEDVELPDPDAPVVSRPGDLWLIGEHRLLCGDARDPAGYDRLMAGTVADMAFADPPYNVRIEGNVSGLGEVVHGEFAMASGEMTEEQFTAFLVTVLGLMANVSRVGAIHFICMDWRHMGELLAAGKKVYSELKNLCVWAKTNAGMGAFYRSQHELVFAFKAGNGSHINNFGLGGKGRHRSNLWTYPGVNVFRKGRAEDLAAHPTVKPTAMVADAILDCSKRNGIVLDPFIGSGTTLLAAERTGRRGYGMEIDPRYADVAIRRLEKESGKKARLESGETFDEVRNFRINGGTGDGGREEL